MTQKENIYKLFDKLKLGNYSQKYYENSTVKRLRHLGQNRDFSRP